MEDQKYVDVIRLRREKERVFNRKREASSSLSEDLQRYNDKVLLMHELIDNGVYYPQFSALENRNNLNDLKLDDKDINRNYCFSSHSTLSSESQDDILQNIDINFQITIKPDCFIKNSPSTSNSDLSVHSASSSVGIQEDLDCLHLADEILNQETAETPTENDGYFSPLVPSLFHKVPPTIYFGLAEEKFLSFPPEISQLLKWKSSTITPVLIRETVEKSGFKVMKKCDSWLGIWDKHMKCSAYASITDYQRVNHYPGSFHLGRKDKMWLNYNKMHLKFESDYSFFPECYLIPQDLRTLRKVWEEDGPKKRWIIKPPASARGTGIKVISKWSQIPKKRPIVVQRYISDPYLINDSKFDLRLYVLVPSFNPLRIYVYEDGLVRFASVKYSTSVRSLSDPFMHLTNYSINKKSSTYTSNEDEKMCQGHKWTLKSFQEYITQRGVNFTHIWEDMLDLIVKTIICVEAPINQLIKNHAKNRYTCYELFGFDIMIDRSLKSWLLEVNVSPSLHIGSPLDFRLKRLVVKDMLNLVGYRLPNSLFADLDLDILLSEYGIPIEEADNICMNRTLHNWFLSPSEKLKHATFTSKSNEDKDILDHLTPDDVRYLIESEDEYARRGSFTRVFPSDTSSKYFQFFHHSRYYNLLLDAWEKKFSQNRVKGLKILKNYCQKSYHLQTIFKETSIQAKEEVAMDV